MGKHGKNTTGKAEKLKAKAQAKRKLLTKARARAPEGPAKAAAAAPPAKAKAAAPPMDVDAFLAGDHLDAAAPDDDASVASSASSSSSSVAAADDHRAELDALRALDPEFYDYLQKNDEGLLAYDDGGDDEDAEEEEEAEAADRRVVTATDVAALAADASTSFRATKRLVALLRAACGGDAAAPASRKQRRRRAQQAAEEEDDSADSVASVQGSSDEDEAAPPAVDFADAATREACARHALRALGPRLRAAAESAAGADLAKLAKAPDRVKALARSVLVGLLKALKGDDAERATRLRVIALEAVAPWAPWLVVDDNLAPRTCRALCGLLCRVVEPAPEEADADRVAMVERETAVQLRAFVALQAVLEHAGSIQVEARGDETVEAHALRRGYAAFARDVAGLYNSEAKARKAFDSVALVTGALVQLYAAADADAAYRTAFVAVRQLALKVRSALATRAAEDVAQVLCWRFLHCARLWARCVCANAGPDRLGELAFPLCQTLFGALELATSPTKAPFRLHCVRALHDLAAATEAFVPTSKPLLATLDECSRGGGGGGGDGRGAVDDDADFARALDCGEKRDGGVRASLGREALEQLGDFLELHRHSPALPELSLVPVVALKKLAKEPRCPQKLRARAKAAAATFEAAADAAAAARARLSAAPKDVVAFEPLKPAGAPPAARRLADRRAARLARRERLRAAADAAPAPKPKKKSKKKAKAPKRPAALAEEEEPAEAPKPKKKKQKAPAADAEDFAMDFSD